MKVDGINDSCSMPKKVKMRTRLKL